MVVLNTFAKMHATIIGVLFSGNGAKRAVTTQCSSTFTLPLRSAATRLEKQAQAPRNQRELVATMG